MDKRDRGRRCTRTLGELLAASRGVTEKSRPKKKKKKKQKKKKNNKTTKEKNKRN